ncbi:MAG: STAS domain-containing protein [Phycisphaerae bacterium]|nr:STAS domain-containing protein [Phycisphaerae bacterium]
MAEASQPLVKGIQEHDGGLVVSLAGEIDYNQSHKLLEVLNSQVEKRPARLIIDLADVEYMDSSGLGTLVKVFQQVNGYKGKMALVAMNDRVRNAFEITRLDQFFSIHLTVDEALQA